MSDTQLADIELMYQMRLAATAMMTPNVQMNVVDLTPPTIDATKSISIFSKQGILVTMTVERPEFYVNHVCIKFSSVVGIANRMVTVSDYTNHMSNIVEIIGNLTICTGCEINFANDDKYCRTCTIQPRARGIDCVICQDEFVIIGKPCQCGQVICMKCWQQYRTREKCPHCRVPYPCLKRRYNGSDNDNDSD